MLVTQDSGKHEQQSKYSKLAKTHLRRRLIYGPKPIPSISLTRNVPSVPENNQRPQRLFIHLAFSKVCRAVRLRN